MTLHAQAEIARSSGPVLSIDKDGILCEYYPTQWITASMIRQALAQRALLTGNKKRPLLVTLLQRINFADDVYSISAEEWLRFVSVVAFALKSNEEDNQTNRMTLTRYLMQVHWPVPAHIFFDEATALLWLRLYL